MISLKHKNKANSSYESEPSFSSGSSLSENESHILDEENMQLPHLLKPTTFIEGIHETLHTGSDNNYEIHETYGQVKVMSSQESFKGFEDASFEQLEKNPKVIVKQNFIKYYDTVVEENSCNAVDIPLSSKLSKLHESQQQLIKPTKISNKKVTSPTNLSFNGKIQSLKANQFQNIINNKTIRNQSAHETSLNASLKSPDLFADDSDSETSVENVPTKKDDDNKSTTADPVENPHNNTKDQVDLNESSVLEYNTQSLYHENCKREYEMLKRIRKCLAGVPPPPSMTYLQLNLLEIIPARSEEILNFLSDMTKSQKETETPTKVSILKPTHALEETLQMGWKEILSVRQHGLCYNLTKASESYECLSLAVVERFIGAETSSSYKSSPSSAKKRNQRLKMLTQSPGNRLSHLARRRAIFSSANLASATFKPHGPQLVIDKKKTNHRRKATPKRLTPGSKKKNRKTPSSSARKRLYRNDLIKPGPSRETSKRALFQSPARQSQQNSLASSNSSNALKFPGIKPEVATRVEKSKRALFSSEDNNSRSSDLSASLKSYNQCGSQSKGLAPFESLLKRKRCTVSDVAGEDADDIAISMQSSKLFRGNNANLTPRALKIKSQSFCIGAGPSSFTAPTHEATDGNSFQINAKSNRFTIGGSTEQLSRAIGSSSVAFKNKMPRALSEMSAPSNSMTENQRKKLLWAVSQALQEKKIGTQHENFRHYATILARVVKRIFQEFHQKTSTSNSETMLRLAKKYAFYVVAGKTADDVYIYAKSQIEENTRLSSTRLSGYIGPEEFEKRKLSQQLSQSQRSQRGSLQNLFAGESSVDWSNLSGCSSLYSATSATSTQTSCLDRIPEDSCEALRKSATKQQSQSTMNRLPIEPSPTLQNSSSKSNLGGLVLRENVDCEHRKSAQKHFTGKDQRNISPYAFIGNTQAASPAVLRLGSGTKPYMPATVSSSSGAKAKRQISFDS